MCVQEQHVIQYGIAHTRSQFRTKCASCQKGMLMLNARWWNRQQNVICILQVQVSASTSSCPLIDDCTVTQ